MTAAFWQLNFLRQVCPPFHKLNPTSFTPMLFELCHSFYYPSSTNKTLRNSLKTKIAMLSLSSPFAHIMESSDNIAIKYINLHICVYIYSLIWVFINVQSHVAVWCPETHGWLLDRVYCLVLCDMPTSMFSLDMCSGVGLLGHTVVLFLSFLRRFQFSIVAIPIYIPINSVEGFPFLHTLTFIVYRLFDDIHSDWWYLTVRW